MLNLMLPLFGAILLCSSVALAAQDDAQGAAQEGASAALPVDVMTFNIRNGKAADGENHWSKRRHNVVATIQAGAPHVLGLQEAYAFQVDYLSEQLPQYQVVGVGRDGGKKGEYSCLFVDKKRLEVVRSGTFWLSDKPDVVASKGWDAALPRICTWAVLRERKGGPEFLVMNSHYDHRGKQARERSAALMHSRLAEFEGLPAIVTGDLNAGEESAPLKALKGDKLRDTFRVLHPDQKTVGTFGGFRGRKDGAKIDYVLCTSEWHVLEASIDRRAFDGRDPSDHFPVLARLRL